MNVIDLPPMVAKRNGEMPRIGFFIPDPDGDICELLVDGLPQCNVLWIDGSDTITEVLYRSIAKWTGLPDDLEVHLNTRPIMIAEMRRVGLEIEAARAA